MVGRFFREIFIALTPGEGIPSEVDEIRLDYVYSSLSISLIKRTLASFSLIT